MELSPNLYHWLIRPKWFVKEYNNRILKSFLDHIDFHNKDVLDYGCGIGSNCYLFEPDYYIGVDIDARRIDYAKKLYKDYRFYTIENNSFIFQEKQFDFIFLMAVLHHIPPQDTSRYLQKFHRVLKPNGKLIIIEPCKSKNSSLQNWFMCFFDKGKYILTEQEYIGLFQQQQFCIEQVKKFKKGYFYNEIFFTAKK